MKEVNSQATFEHLRRLWDEHFEAKHDSDSLPTLECATCESFFDRIRAVVEESMVPR